MNTIVVDGVTLETAWWGPNPGTAPTLVLLHEGLGCVALWRDVPERLASATGLGVFAYSRQGYGSSDPCTLPRPLDYMTREAVGTLPAVLDAVGVQRAVLVGHSDGATIAAIHAGSVADRRVRGIVLIAPHFFSEPHGLAAIQAAVVDYERGSLRDRLAKYHRHVDAAFRGWSGAWLDPAFAKWSVADVIDYIRVPVLAIQGETDAYGTWAQIEALDERTYCPLEVLRLACGHAPHLECTDAVVAHVAAWCAQLIRIEAAGST